MSMTTDLDAKKKRLKELSEVLDTEMRDPYDIAERVNKRYSSTKMSGKVAQMNLMELYIWANEGRLDVKVKIGCKPTTRGYLFWKEEGRGK